MASPTWTLASTRARRTRLSNSANGSMLSSDCLLDVRDSTRPSSRQSVENGIANLPHGLEIDEQGVLVRPWLEPMVQAQASFEQDGLLRFGVLENMAPLGTLPPVLPSNPKKKVSASTGRGEKTASGIHAGAPPRPKMRRIILRQSAGGLSRSAAAAILPLVLVPSSEVQPKEATEPPLMDVTVTDAHMMKATEAEATRPVAMSRWVAGSVVSIAEPLS